MRITANQLRRIIKEETLRVLTESPDMDPDLDKLERQIKQHLRNAQNALDISDHSELANQLGQYANAWRTYSYDHPEASYRADMAANTARKLIATAKNPRTNPEDIYYDINSLADDVYAYKLELEKSNP